MPGRFYFIGVSTASSSVVGMFPEWARLLGLDAELIGRDLPLDASPRRYREVVEEIAADPEARGALVTSHKVGIFRYAEDMFHELDHHARACAEVSCIAKRSGRLSGYAKDPITGGRTLAEMIGDDYFARRPAQVLCLGAGGAGVALTQHLMSLPAAPQRVLLTDIDPDRLKAAAQAHTRSGDSTPGQNHPAERPDTRARDTTPGQNHPAERPDTRTRDTTPGQNHPAERPDARVGGTTSGEDQTAGAIDGRAGGGVAVEYHPAGVADDLIGELPPGSLVINATGMGKDRPGSPLSGRAVFPEHGVVWDLNYRGELEFLAQARAADRSLVIHDGWRYFLHGWAEHTAEVFGLDLDDSQFAELVRVSERFRPSG